MVWVVDNLKSVGGNAVSVEGSPRVVDTDKGRAVAFNGASDGIVLDVNPVEGMTSFTIEALFRPDADGAPEQRFFHIQESDRENRVLLETRVPAGKGTWYGDTYIHIGKKGTALNDPKLTHPTAAWHTLALVFDGKRMAQYVDGVKELAGGVAFQPMGRGRTSIGMRINKVHWFKGVVREVRISPRALAPEELLRP
jgi:hypothetical protein